MKISDYVLILVVFLITLSGLCTSIYVGDSSLFSAASFSLGSAHPPGYPLFVLLGKLLTFLPFGNVAMKTNLVSAIFATLACLLVFRVSMMLTGNVYASWASAVTCCISPVFFTESLKAEAYVLNGFLVMAVFMLGLLILEGKSLFRYGLLGLFTIGLGMGNHHTMGFMGLVFLFPIAVRWKEVRMQWVPLGTLFFLLGFSVNSLLYLRSVAMVHSGGLILYSFAGSWHDFVRVLLRQDYSGSHSSTSQALAQGLSLGVPWLYGAKNSILGFVYPNMRPVLPFLFAGFFSLWKKKKVFGYFVFAILVWFFLLGRMVWGSKDLSGQDVEVISVYFLPAIPILYCLVAAGFALALEWAGRLSSGLLHRVAPYALVSLPLALLPYSYRLVDTYKAPIAYDYGRDMLSVLPVSSLLMNNSDNAMFITFYMRMVERLREDVLVINTGGKKDIYGLESSPPWKYSRLFPAFYETSKSSVKQINEEFALKGKLFASNPLTMTMMVTQFYEYYPYVLSVGLWPKGRDAEEFEKDTRVRFMKEYPKINYERVLEQPFRNDFMEEELDAEYSLNTMIYGGLLKRQGDERAGDKFYSLAFSAGNPRKFLWPYIAFLLKDGRKEEALSLLGTLKTAGGEEGRFIDSLEKKAESAVEVRGLSR